MALLEAQSVRVLGSNVRRRVELWLEATAARSRMVDHRGRLLPYQASQTELAQIIGSSRVAVNRALQQLEADGRIVREGRRIFVRNQAAATRT
jgi:DNA-binding MarR family transcriptional regulator